MGYRDAPQYYVIRTLPVLFGPVTTEPERCNVRSKAVLVLKRDLTGGSSGQTVILSTDPHLMPWLRMSLPIAAFMVCRGTNLPF